MWKDMYLGQNLLVCSMDASCSLWYWVKKCLRIETPLIFPSHLIVWKLTNQEMMIMIYFHIDTSVTDHSYPPYMSLQVVSY